MTVAGLGPIVLIGAGNMGGAMLAGWLKSGVSGSSVIVIDPGPQPAMAKLIADNGARHGTSAPEGVKAGVLGMARTVAASPRWLSRLAIVLPAATETMTVSGPTRPFNGGRT